MPHAPGKLTQFGEPEQTARTVPARLAGVGIRAKWRTRERVGCVGKGVSESHSRASYGQQVCLKATTWTCTEEGGVEAGLFFLSAVRISFSLGTFPTH